MSVLALAFVCVLVTLAFAVGFLLGLIASCVEK